MDTILLYYLFLAVFTFVFLHKVLELLVISEQVSMLEEEGRDGIEHLYEAYNTGIHLRRYFWLLLGLAVMAPLIWGVTFLTIIVLACVVLVRTAWYCFKG